MKKLLVAISFVAFLASCSQEEDPVPGTDDRQKFYGAWNIDANGSHSGHLAYTIEILADTPSNAISMKNFDFLGNTFYTYAQVDGNSVNIPSQVVDGNTISGSGSYSNGQITFSYSSNDGVYNDMVTATASR